MRKLTEFFFLYTIIQTSLITAFEENPLQREYHILYASSAEVHDLEYFFNEGDKVAVCFEEGDQFPFYLTLKSDLFSFDPSLEDQKVELTVERSFYVKPDIEEGMLFSKDLETWSGVGEFFTGSISAYFGASDEEKELSTGLSFEFNVRDSQ